MVRTSGVAMMERPVTELMTGLSRRRRRAILGQMSRAAMPAGRLLTQEGATGREFFVLTGGRVEVCVHGEPVAEVEPGDFFGEISLLRGCPRTATVVASDDVTLEVMNRREFAAVLDLWPSLARSVSERAIQRLVALEN
ncbi:MAG: cyclic nucleotide-binding domain-containing protein [Acidimicrobiia bacterium]|nr:cyclic nucleotide-binding domain-containing protein [Acidimicrobiia bacterium]MDH5236118.1 cyclic nucleotide-binding domain-containing protein [Acidimicrobiia bacterium]